jgi:hypothetical protein
MGEQGTLVSSGKTFHRSRNQSGEVLIDRQESLSSGDLVCRSDSIKAYLIRFALWLAGVVGIQPNSWIHVHSFLSKIVLMGYLFPYMSLTPGSGELE